MFSPEDLQLIKGEPQLRRRFFDMQIAQTDKAYYELLVKYNRLLQQRNRLLKEIRDNNGDKGQLNLWNNELSASAARIIKNGWLRLKNCWLFLPAFMLPLPAAAKA